MSFLKIRLRTIAGENASWSEALLRITYYVLSKTFSAKTYTKIIRGNSGKLRTDFLREGSLSGQQALAAIEGLQSKPDLAVVVLCNETDKLERTRESIDAQYYKPAKVVYKNRETDIEVFGAGYVLILNEGSVLSKDALLQVALTINTNNAQPKAIYFWEQNKNNGELGYKSAWNSTFDVESNTVNHAFIHHSIFKPELLNDAVSGLYQLLQSLERKQVVCIRKVLLQDDRAKEKIRFTESAVLNEKPLVSIVIPTRNKFHLVKQTIDSIYEKTTYRNYEIVLVDNGSDEPALLEYVQQLKNDSARMFTCITDNMPFNFSALINLGVEHSRGTYLILLNNDVQLITPEWIALMLKQASLQNVGAVGAKLLYPNKTIQHAGIVLGKNPVSKHVFVGKGRNEKVANNAINTNQNYLAVTAACLMVSREKFNAVKGFDPEFKVEYNDIDFCLKMYEKGWNNVYLHAVELFHYESASRRHPQSDHKSYKQYLSETRLLKKKWYSFVENDPFNIYSI